MSERDPLGIVGHTIEKKYQVEELIGEGGFAVVYRATHIIWKQPVAIKLFSGLSMAPAEQRDGLRDAFIQEGALLSDLSTQTAGIVQARDVGTFTSPDGQWMPFMVLEWLDGRSLEALLDAEFAEHRQPRNLTRAMQLLAPVADALDVVHERGVAHRDIKPSNLFLLDAGSRKGGSTLKILDFGVAKLMADNTEMKAALAKTGLSITSFTPQYGAPEQFSRAHGATGPWTDVFALALVLVELLAGRQALDGEEVGQLGFASSNPNLRPTPRTLGVPVSDEVEAVFQKALAVAPAERYERAADFWSALSVAAAVSDGDTVLAPSNPVASSPLSAPGAPHTPVSMPGSGAAGRSTGPLTATTAASPVSRGGAVALGTAVAAALIASAAAGFLWWRSANAESREVPAVAAALGAASAAVEATAATLCPAGMAKIPAGQFFMGSDLTDAMASEKPAHQVKLDAFCIDLHEVTVNEYKDCSDQGKCRRAGTRVTWPGVTEEQKRTYAPLCNSTDPSRGDHPINCVSWDMARNFCEMGDRRLPTEAEWEYATRGPDGRVYPWGDEAPTEKHLNACGTECVKWGNDHGESLRALYEADDGFATTAPVGKFEAGRSRFGPYDVVGNVWEWVGDWYGEYSAAARTNPTGPDRGEKRVIRGGGWNGSYASWLRPSFRYAQDPEALSHGIGFRCARSLDYSGADGRDQ